MSSNARKATREANGIPTVLPCPDFRFPGEVGRTSGESRLLAIRAGGLLAPRPAITSDVDTAGRTQRAMRRGMKQDIHNGMICIPGGSFLEHTAAGSVPQLALRVRQTDAARGSALLADIRSSLRSGG